MINITTFSSYYLFIVVITTLYIVEALFVLKFLVADTTFFSECGAFYIITLIVQQNYFSDLYLIKILDLSGQPFFPCTILQVFFNISRTYCSTYSQDLCQFFYFRG